MGAAIAALALLGVASAARADVLQDLGATYQKVAEELVTTFPKVEVRVAEWRVTASQ